MAAGLTSGGRRRVRVPTGALLGGGILAASGRTGKDGEAEERKKEKLMHGRERATLELK